MPSLQPHLPRRVPKQARARARVDRILAAARRELATLPAAEITIEAIAERAGVGVGSVYSYFSSKGALLVAVAEAVMEEADRETGAQLAECLRLPWREAVDRVVTATLGFLRDAPDYRKLVRTIRFTAEFAGVTAKSNERVAALIASHPAFREARIPRRRALEICRTAVTAANALQDRALAGKRLDFDGWVDETKRLVKGYLATYLP